MLRQKATAGVSLAVALFLVLHRKWLFFKCFAVLHQRFFLTPPLCGRRNTCCLSRPKSKVWGKRSVQNQILSYGTPPKPLLFCSYQRRCYFLRAKKVTKDALGLGERSFAAPVRPTPDPIYYEGKVKSCLLLFSASNRVAFAFVYGRHALLCLVEIVAYHLYASALPCRGADATEQKKTIHTPPQQRLSGYEGGSKSKAAMRRTVEVRSS